MPDPVAFALSVFFRLSDEDKAQVAVQIRDYLNTGIPLRASIEEAITVVLRPPPYGCPICGR
jgi:hypothetical protein